MPKAKKYNLDGKAMGDVDLPEPVFGIRPNQHVLWESVKAYLANQRQGTASTKTRSKVRGGGRKPWRQKGTGRARQGSIRSPQWRGGGVVFGPRTRSHAHKLNKRVRRAALCSALSRRVEENKIVVLDDLSFPEMKTRQVVDLMKTFELNDMLLVLGAADDNVARSARNLKSVTVLLPEGVNVYDVLLRDNLVLTKSAVQAIADRLGV